MPGIRKGNKFSTKRDIVAVLQLTAMVDIFTVLVVFLLQNYASTDQILPISEQIVLPQAQQVKDLKPSHVVILSEGRVRLNEDDLGVLRDLTSRNQWVFAPLREKMAEAFKEAEKGPAHFLVNQLKKINLEDKEEDFVQKTPFRVTIQADETTEFVDIKKIMYTLTEAGVKEINFAVVKAAEPIPLKPF